MDSLFNLPVEKYWDFTSKYSKEDKVKEINNCINSNEYIGSEKIDGHYNRTVIDFDGSIRMESRTVSTVTGEHGDKQFHVPHISEILKNSLPKGTILIGELYYPGATSQEVGKILQCKPPKAVERQNGAFGKLKYYIHDIWYYNNKNIMDIPYQERIKYLDNLKNISNNYIQFAEHKNTPADIRELMETVFANNGEGIVLVRKDAIVEPGKRPAWKTIKVKRELDKHIDCFFTGNYKMGARLYIGKEIESWMYWENLKTGEKLEGKYYEEYEDGMTIEPVTKSYFYGVPGSFEIGVFKDRNIVSIGYISGITDDMRNNYKNYTMQPCEVTCMQFTEDGNLRHPRLVRIRDDISTADCTWEKIHG